MYSYYTRDEPDQEKATWQFQQYVICVWSIKTAMRTASIIGQKKKVPTRRRRTPASIEGEEAPPPLVHDEDDDDDAEPNTDIPPLTDESFMPNLSYIDAAGNVEGLTFTFEVFSILVFFLFRTRTAYAGSSPFGRTMLCQNFAL